MNAADFRQYICRACGYIYDEALGDPDGGLAAGTRYADIPDDWMCPLCGVGKADFEPYVVADATSASRAAAAASTATPGAGAAAVTAWGKTGTRARPAPIVIVGAGVAGWAVAKAVRALDAEVPMTLITGCSGCVYPKPQLSVALAQGRDAAAIVSETGEVAAARLRLRLMPGTWITGIDAPRRRLRSTHGALRYGHLVLALGAAPLPLPLDEASLRLVWRINHLDHYARFRGALGAAPRRVAVIGAGLVGCELADDLAGAGHQVTLIDMAPAPLGNLASAQEGAALAAALGRAGVRFLANTKVDAIRKTAQGLVLSAGTQAIAADLVLAATGLGTDPRLARSAGIAFNRGISVDPASMRSSDPAILALGDCASFDGKAYRFIEPIHRQAAVAAATMLGKESPGFELRTVPVRLKSRSMPMTLQFAA